MTSDRGECKKKTYHVDFEQVTTDEIRKKY